MSVIVKGMEMPEDCRGCPFENYHSNIGQTVCMASLRVLATGFKTISFDGRHCSCPLVALPDKHGRLVDADELIEQMEADAEHMYEPYARMMYSAAISDVRHASGIVEAEDKR